MSETSLVVEQDTSLFDLWELLPEGTEDVLLGLDPDGRKGEKEVSIDGVGRVKFWLEACSEGADRGGYVVWYELLNVHGYDGKPLLLEGDTDGESVLFAGRRSVLF